MKKYEKYKEVGLPWLKEIPEGWVVKPIRDIFYERGETNSNLQENRILSVMKGIGVVPYEDKGNVGNKASEDISKYKIVKVDDIVLNSMNVIIGSVGKSKYEGALSQVYYVLVNRNINSNNTNFLDYCFRTEKFYAHLKIYGRGILEHRLKIPMSSLKGVHLPIPPLHEQEHIANFLDWKISEIDRLIELEKEKIQRIKEYYDRLNESYFEEIERNYDEIIKIRNFAKLQNGISESGAFFLKGKPFINYSDVFNNDVLPNQFENVADSNKKQQELYSVRKGDLFITRTSETVEDAASVCLCKETVNKAVFSGFLIRLRAFNPINSDEFLLYYLKSMVVRNQIISNLNIVTRVSVTQNLIKNINLKIIPSEVQESVVKNINKNNINKNTIIELYIKNISYLEELKQTLVSDAVTGKIDVRNIKIPDYTHGKEEA